MDSEEKDFHNSMVSPDDINSLMSQVQLQNIENDNNFRAVTNEEMKEILDFIKKQDEYKEFCIVNQGSQVISDGNATAPEFEKLSQSIAPFPSSTENSLTNSAEFNPDEWVLVSKGDKEDEKKAQLLFYANQQLSFFDNWPSFDVYSKLKVVLGFTATTFTFGFLLGINAAVNSLFRLIEHPIVAGGVGIASTYAFYYSPAFFAKGVAYVVVGGVVGATSAATPVFVIGSGGVFVAASVYHSYIASKRLLVGVPGTKQPELEAIELLKIENGKKSD